MTGLVFNIVFERLAWPGRGAPGCLLPLVAIAAGGCTLLNDTDDFEVGTSELRPACSIGERRCNDRVPQVCSESGTWADEGEACEGKCVSGVCVECAPEVDRRCDGAVPRRCNADARWEDAGEACAIGCTAGACIECEGGALDCDLDGRRLICIDGSWRPLADEVCEFGCLPTGACAECRGDAAECVDETTSLTCVSGVLETVVCSGDAPRCVDGVCRACTVGSRRCSPDGTPQICSEDGQSWLDGEPCGATSWCLAQTGRCGVCEQGARRPCPDALGNCATGYETCRADGSWGECDVQPLESDDPNDCTPGADANCNGTPRETCDCTEDAECGVSNEGQCTLGVSACVDGQPQACVGASGPFSRDCSSALDNDCDGTPDDEVDADDGPCRCTPGSVRRCGLAAGQVGNCRAGMQRCLLGAGNLTSDWGPCEGATGPRPPSCASPDADVDCDGVPDGDRALCQCRLDDPPRACGEGACAAVSRCELAPDGGTRFTPCPTATVVPAFNPPQPIAGAPAGDIWSPAPLSTGELLVFAGGSPESIFVGRRSGVAELAGVARVQGLRPPNGHLDGTPFPSFDLESLYFYSTRPGGSGNRDLWVASFDPPGSARVSDVRLVEGINGPDVEQHPWLSPDERLIIFDSDRSGDSDLWQARRAGPGAAFSSPRPIDELNTPSVDEGPGLTSDGLMIFFASNRPGSLDGLLDVWVAIRSSLDAPFSEPVNLRAVNSADQDLDIGVSPDGSELFFSSSRQGPQRLYVATRACR